ncbi:unnamed protein product [Heligmosomoides polygyrus]|uniref:HTH OST-type domain-containing protein n=1 Tax=Heligmosomoides polygyrus TaxID=6339 RepID=A0A3P7YH60_HELPZ|nr:unnamed protein product [Heligmosomoides polygyrus]
MDKRRSATGLQQRQAVNCQKEKTGKEGHHSASPETTFETQSTSTRSVAGNEVGQRLNSGEGVRCTIPSIPSRLPPLIERTTKSPVQRVANLFVTLFGKVSSADLPSKWSATYKNVEKLTKILESNEKLPGARVYGESVYDLVMESGDGQKPKLAEVRGCLLLSLGGKNARILSPRVAPLMPERDHPKGFLSPSLFPFYKDDAEEQIMPVPKVDRFTVFPYFSYFSFKVAESFERLRASLKKGQTIQLDKRGFTFMEPSQLKKLHDDQGTPKKSHTSIVHLWADIQSRRWKRQSTGQFVTLSVLQPFILSPYQFAPVYGLTVLGPVVLSPNIFSPLILNPAVLSPWVLSPSVPLPFILSPYVLSPYVLNPLVMAPYILTPYALSPNVITPYALSPVILSPLFLCPDLLSPMVLSGPILSPSMLSPSILSKSYLMANVLSPTFLS